VTAGVRHRCVFERAATDGADQSIARDEHAGADFSRDGATGNKHCHDGDRTSFKMDRQLLEPVGHG
jgi:hypothetical protein